MNLAVNQNSEALTGQINLSGWLGRVANVTGTVAPDGSMTLQGGDSWPRMGFCAPPGWWNILSWNARYDAQADQITGAFTYTTQKHLSSCYYTQDLIVNATNVVLRRGAAIDPSFAGHRQGTYRVVKCTPVLWTICFTPDDDPPFNLQLSQSGTTVTGELTNIPCRNSTPPPVSGSAASAPRLDLSGARLHSVCEFIARRFWAQFGHNRVASRVRTRNQGHGIRSKTLHCGSRISRGTEVFAPPRLPAR